LVWLCVAASGAGGLRLRRYGFVAASATAASETLLDAVLLTRLVLSETSHIE